MYTNIIANVHKTDAIGLAQIPKSLRGKKNSITRNSNILMWREWSNGNLNRKPTFWPQQKFSQLLV